MQTGHHQSSHHGCGGQSRGPEVFYGYCHETNRMRMMDYTDYMNNMQTGYSNLYSNPASSMQLIIDALSGMMRSAISSTAPTHHRRITTMDAVADADEQDCGCSCCIRCADVIEYARCGEVRQIPITFDNDTRRERDVTLQLGNFATESGQDVGLAGIAFPHHIQATAVRRNHGVAHRECGLQQAGRPVDAGPTSASPPPRSTAAKWCTRLFVQTAAPYARS